MLKLIRTHQRLRTPITGLPTYQPLFSSSNYYGPHDKFKLGPQDLKISTSVQVYVDKYRRHGHHYAQIDPLEIRESKKFPALSEFDLDQGLSMKNALSLDSFIGKQALKSLQELESFLVSAYTQNVGVEFDHVTDIAEREWLYNQFEENISSDLSNDERKKIVRLLAEGEEIDHFIGKKYQTFKRYSGEGTESLLVALNTVFASATDAGVKDIVLAMPHRGRFNVLVELLDYPAQDLFYKISGKNDLPDDLYTGIDDVTSHVGVSTKKAYSRGDKKGSKEINVSLLHNPSHLEAVNPVSMGKTKAKQDDNSSRENTMNVQIHGDAAFAGQGIIYESFVMSRLPSYNIDGTVHIVCNNQIGFTTTPKDGRSSQYTTDIVKPFGVPVVHVNADCPEDVLKVSDLAVKYRQKFKKDFMIDLIGYRRYGHNELDEPEFTQPKMYSKIRKNLPTAPKAYSEQLSSSGVVSADEISQIRSKINEHLESEYRARESIKKTKDQLRDEEYKGNRTLTGKWNECVFSQDGKDSATGVEVEALRKLAAASIHTPDDFNVHQRIKNYHIKARQTQTEKNTIDWATAEALAFGSLVTEGVNVRMTGQDVERGTFSHRHLVFTDVNDEKKWAPFKQNSEHFSPKGRFHLHNSPLSEASVISYELGYSMESPNNLSIWEAQFGDFFNPAQVAFDTFITCSEAKWLRQSSLVVLLPHGMDGAGPEHSSCRIERFLQMAATDGGNRMLTLKDHDPNRKRLQIEDGFFYENHQDVNFQFAQPSTPSNYFHLLRRQMRRNYRKPLIVATPKILLKHPQAKSSFEDLGPNGNFQALYTHQEGNTNLKDVQTAIFCTGKISYDIRAAMAKAPENFNKVALFTVEELLPFPEKLIKEKLSQINKSAKVVWIQEETMTSGALSYAEPRLARVIRELGFENQNVVCHARRAVASTAVGSSELNSVEAKAILNVLNNYKN